MDTIRQNVPRCARKERAVAKKSKVSVPFQSFPELSIVSIFFLFPLFFSKGEKQRRRKSAEGGLAALFFSSREKKGEKEKKILTMPTAGGGGQKEKEKKKNPGLKGS